ncbi:MAG TPA: PilZ domain-containing protein [Vicinamibacterales bacterium]
MPQPCTVLIAAQALMPALKERTATDGYELLAFADSDALRALEVITKRRPAIVALDRAFAASPRGAALINRIKGDPSLVDSEIRVVSHDSHHARAISEPEGASGVAGISDAPTQMSQALDESGTRGAPRLAMAKGVEALIDGNAAVLVDLSIGGAQVLSATVLKPNQRVRLTLTDARGTIRISGTVGWATFEIPPRYRAGIIFVGGSESAAIEAYALRHKA